MIGNEFICHSEELSLGELSKDFNAGILKCPDIKRTYTWSHSQILAYFETVYVGYPTSPFTVWQDKDLPPTKKGNISFILDGQQRVATLAAIFKQGVIEMNDQPTTIDLMFNLDHPGSMVKMTHETLSEVAKPFAGREVPDTEKTLSQFSQMTFAFSNSVIEHLPNWVKVSDVVEPSVWHYFDILGYMHSVGVKRPTDPKYKKYYNRLDRLQHILESRHTLWHLSPDISYDQAHEICGRLNPHWK